MQLHLPAATSAARLSPAGYKARPTDCQATACSLHLVVCAINGSPIFILISFPLLFLTTQSYLVHKKISQKKTECQKNRTKLLRDDFFNALCVYRPLRAPQCTLQLISCEFEKSCKSDWILMFTNWTLLPVFDRRRPFRSPFHDCPGALIAGSGRSPLSTLLGHPPSCQLDGVRLSWCVSKPIESTSSLRRGGRPSFPTRWASQLAGTLIFEWG